jgi:serine phosphatase RsbU (regulator of sigma subunit)
MEVLTRFAETLRSEETDILQHVREYIAAQSGHGKDFALSDYDDVPIRTYMLSLRDSGISPSEQHRRMASLRRFYTWALDEGLIEENPFKAYSLERPRLSREQIRRRKEIITGSPEEREIARLRALNRLAEQLNRSSDVHTTLSTALETMIALMNLQTGWAFLLPYEDDPAKLAQGVSTGDFRLATAYGLPPGLERQERYYLSNPDGCHCQGMFAAGKMRRAVNIVECTRLRQSAAAEGDNQGLMFHASIPILASGRPVGILNVATEEWQFLTATDLQLLSAIGTQVGIALERARLYDLTMMQQKRLAHELRMAREVQESLLPDVLPHIAGFSLAADWRSAMEMAGDFFDVFGLSDGQWGIVIADVSDKGAAAAMYMAMTHSLLRASATAHTSPAATLKEVNQRLNAHSSSDMFVTLFYAVLDPETRSFTYANAGQNPPLLRRTTGEIKRLSRTGTSLGVVDELVLSEVRLTLGPGEALVAYTDGLTDALNPLGEEYGLARLTQIIAGAPQLNAEDLLDHILKDLAAFTQRTTLLDDITLLILVSGQ